MYTLKTLFITYLLLIMMCSGCQNKNNQELLMLVGTYTSGSSEGIYTYQFNTDDLTATPLNKAIIDNPSYLTISPDRRFVYAVSESGEAYSAVTAFSFDETDGSLQHINRINVGADPCFILLDALRNFVVTANYSGGSASLIPLDKDGGLIESGHLLQFDGSGTDTIRQTKPHLHCIAMTPDKQTLFATDLGTDCIYKMNVHLNEKKEISSLDYDKSENTTLTPGSGPRHLIFNKKGTYGYLINELSGKVTVFTVDSQNNLNEIQSILADTCYAEGSADIHLSPDEKYLYASTRLKGDGIVIFKINSDGKITKTGYQATNKHPRNFAITPDGSLLLAACKESNMIQIFSIDKKTGLLTDTGKNILIDQPVCIQFANK